MLALRLYGKEDLRLEDAPEPILKDSNAILKVKATTICATDVKAYLTGARTKIPITLGHEFAGDIVEAKGALRDYVGKRVVVNPNIFDGKCEYCLSGEHVLCPNRYAIGIDVDGSFAEYVEIPIQAFNIGGVLEIPKHLSYEEASIIEPLAACLRGQLKLNIRPGDVIAIIGAGPIGLMHYMLAKTFGAGQTIISEVDDRRIAVAKGLGVEYVVNPLKEDIEKAILELTNGHGVDSVIVAVGSPHAQRDALRIIRKGGRINFFAGLPPGSEEVPINTNIIHYKQITVLGTSMQTPIEFKKTLELVASRLVNVKPLITHRYSLRDGLEAFSKSLKAEALKISLTP